EPFLVADKFNHEIQDQLLCFSSVQNLSVLRKDKLENNQTILEQQVIYEKLYEIYKKALSKALQKCIKSHQLICLLQEFVDMSDESDLD
ncbi:5061_t:CDS:1, partial [Racocetra fulgida]